MTPKHSLEIEVKLDKAAVWNLITDARLFHGLRIPGLHDEFDRATAKPGTKFMCMFMSGGGKFPMYIVDWEPQKRFSFGSSPFGWTFRWELADSSEGTHIHFQRKFRSISSVGRVIDFLRGKPYLKQRLKLMDDTRASLTGACNSLAQDGSHGLTPW